MNKEFKILDHPADLGIEARGSTLAEAFSSAAIGLMSVILDLSAVSPADEKEIIVTAGDVEQLLVKWLSEILYLYDGRRFISKEFIIHDFEPTRLRAVVRGENFSEAKHRTRLEVKAITYHQLLVEEKIEGGLVRFYVDI
jgi:SHS2 domain-containing protein